MFTPSPNASGPPVRLTAVATEMITLVAVLRGINSFAWRDGVYLPSDAPWTPKSQCAVLGSDDFAGDEDEPQFAKDHQLQFALSVNQTRQIVENARRQRSELTDDDLFKAFLHYYDNDAFIEYR